MYSIVACPLTKTAYGGTLGRSLEGSEGREIISRYRSTIQPDPTTIGLERLGVEGWYCIYYSMRSRNYTT